MPLYAIQHLIKEKFAARRSEAASINWRAWRLLVEPLRQIKVLITIVAKVGSFLDHEIKTSAVTNYAFRLGKIVFNGVNETVDINN